MEKQIRTLGDGMDNTLINRKPVLGVTGIKNIKVDSNLSKSILDSLKPIAIEPGTKVSYLVPKYVPKERKVPKYLTKKRKEPKFVPYEPYKAAVQPITSNKVISKTFEELKPSKNNVEIQQLVNQMSEIREFELNKTNIVSPKDEDPLKLRLQWEKEKEGYEIDIKNLRETNSHLENQLKFQAQVNSELKTLLVAAVGEDLESRVQHLTEDKLSLARALLNSANHLTSHQEQTEWLSGQCEVWRSKFLASSLMVEELAKWKSALAIRSNELQEVLKSLLDERKKIQKKNMKTFSNLKVIAEKVTSGSKNVELKYGNIIEVANVNHELTEGVLQALNLGDEVKKPGISSTSVQVTVAEKTAIKLLQNPVTITNKQDALCNAVMGAATSLGGRQMFLQHPSLHACCSHCKGEVLNI
ncbi:golgin-45 [Anoplophora glabripennis]|uniref:golgin-45 n=1 Tax=Anoplophora glabripennis TaxID=217634 RepID=UPI0008735C59|nr:golgin-45 [Anoplophora glabripennis]